MDFLQNFHLKLTKNDIEFTFVIPQGTTWGAAYDAAFEILSEITKLASDAKDKMAPKPAEENNNANQKQS